MLQEYTNTILAINQFKEKHADVFNEFEKLMELKGQQEVELKNWAKENGDQNNGVVAVRVDKKYKKWYDVETLKQSEYWRVISENAYSIEEKINKDKLDEMAKEGSISRELLRDAFREEEMSPAVSIKLL